MERHNVLKESIIASLIIVLITYLISFLPISLEYGKALHQGYADFDIYDICYAGKTKYINTRDTNIILLELGADRSEIAGQINRLSKFNPIVIGLDVKLEHPNFNQADSLGDLNLRAALINKSNIVYSVGIDKDKNIIPNYFVSDSNNIKTGYINFSGDEIAVIREYSPFNTFNNNRWESFSSAIARIYKPEKYEELRKRNNTRELIDYSGNIDYYTTFSKSDFNSYSDSDLSGIIKNKIVLIGFFVRQNENKQPPLVIEDLHFTPLNDVLSGKSYPDMYGVVIHANILSMILKGKYPTLIPLIISYLFAFLFTLFFNYFIIHQFHKKEHPHHGLFLLIQLASILLVVFMFVELYDYTLIKIQLEPILISMVLCLEMLGLYKSFALWLHKKYKYVTIFNHKRII